MIENDIVCPHCSGKGTNMALVDGVINGRQRGWSAEVKCSTCGGSGSINREHADRIEAGRILRDDRVARGMSLREEASRLHISPMLLSDREAGRIGPAPSAHRD